MVLKKVIFIGILYFSLIKTNNMAKNEQTGKSVASIASKLLSNPNTPKDVKTVAASVLTQSADKKPKR